MNKLFAIEKIVVVNDEIVIQMQLETQLRNKCFSVASTSDLKEVRKILLVNLSILSIWICACLMVMAPNS